LTQEDNPKESRSRTLIWDGRYLGSASYVGHIFWGLEGRKKVDVAKRSLEFLTKRAGASKNPRKGGGTSRRNSPKKKKCFTATWEKKGGGGGGRRRKAARTASTQEKKKKKGVLGPGVGRGDHWKQCCLPEMLNQSLNGPGGVPRGGETPLQSSARERHMEKTWKTVPYWTVTPWNPGLPRGEKKGHG